MGSKRQYGSGSVYQRGDGKWVAQIRVADPLAGKSKVVRRYASNRAEARERLKELQATPQAPGRANARGTTLADWLTHWKADLLPHAGLAPKSQTMYSDLLDWYGIPAAGQVRLRDFTPSLGEQWVARLRDIKKRNGDPISASTVRNTFNAALKALDAAVREGLIPTNPLRQVARPQSPRPVVGYTTAEHVDALLVDVNGRKIEALVWLVAMTGCRIGEALGLRWCDLDLDNARVTFRVSAPGMTVTKTKGSTRTVSLVPEVVTRLKAVKKAQRLDRLAAGPDWQGGTKADALVFTTKVGTPLSRGNVTRDLKASLVRVGADTARPWHSLRHGLATRLILAGLPLAVVSQILGHSSTAFTASTYAHLDGAVPADVLAAALGRPAASD